MRGLQHILSTALMLAILTFLPGCGLTSGLVPPSSLPQVTESESAADLRRVDFATVPTLALDPVWTKRYNHKVQAYMSPDGESIVISGRFPGRGLGLVVLDQNGKQRWQYTFPGNWSASAQVSISGSPGAITAVVNDAAQTGNAYAFMPSGDLLWQRPVDGAASVIASTDGQRFLLVNTVAGRLQLISRKNEVLANETINPHGTAQFINDRNLVLINDANRVKLLDASGKTLWSHQVDSELKGSVAVSGDTRLIAITTTGRDSSIYAFDAKGKLKWGRQLLLGGTNRPVFSSDSEVLYVYNVGSGAGIYAFQAETGDLLWRTVFDNSKIKRAVTTGFFPSRDILTWDYSTGDAGDGHWLIIQDRNGTRFYKYRLGKAAVVHGTSNGRHVLVTQADPGVGANGTSVRLFNLSGVIPTEG